jgi:hypothetical protein
MENSKQNKKVLELEPSCGQHTRGSVQVFLGFLVGRHCGHGDRMTRENSWQRRERETWWLVPLFATETFNINILYDRSILWVTVMLSLFLVVEFKFHFLKHVIQKKIRRESIEVAY